MRRAKEHQSNILVASTELADRKEKLGLGGAHKRRGFGFTPTLEAPSSDVSEEEWERLSSGFIAQCARAHREGRLSAKEPICGGAIGLEIRKAGGNLLWLSKNLFRRQRFLDAYSFQMGWAVPYDLVWKNNAPPMHANVKASKGARNKLKKELKKKRMSQVQELVITDPKKLERVQKNLENISRRMQGVVVEIMPAAGHRRRARAQGNDVDA